MKVFSERKEEWWKKAEHGSRDITLDGKTLIRWYLHHLQKNNIEKKI